jgi:hypothetical protein
MFNTLEITPEDQATVDKEILKQSIFENIVMDKRIDPKVKTRLAEIFTEILTGNDDVFPRDDVEIIQGTSAVISDVLVGRHVNLTTIGDKIRMKQGDKIIYRLPEHIEQFAREAIPKLADSDVGNLPTIFNTAGESFGQDTIKSVLRGFLSNNRSNAEIMAQIESLKQRTG